MVGSTVSEKRWKPRGNSVLHQNDRAHRMAVGSFVFGRTDKIRTCDLFHPKEAL